MQTQRTRQDHPKHQERTTTQRIRELGPREIDPELRHQMIEEAAYYEAMHRGFAPGHDLEDWLVAETQVEQLLHGGPRL